MAKGMPYFGTILGCIFTGMLGDNFGRKNTLIFSLMISIFGYLLIIFAKSLITASIGLFFAGLGVESCYNLAIIYAS